MKNHYSDLFAENYFSSFSGSELFLLDQRLLSRIYEEEAKAYEAGKKEDIPGIEKRFSSIEEAAERQAQRKRNTEG